jgi:natural product precursor
MKTLGKLKLKAEKLLSHEELVNFRGGSGSGTCGWNGGGVSAPVCGISKDNATALQSTYGGYWCCDSCGSASYC